VLTGFVRSTLIVSECHVETLPALSTARVSSSCVPSVSTTAVAPVWVAPPSTRHSPWS
jgi:hypothetical protein